MKRLTQAEFARLCRVNRSTVNRWLKNGRIEADAQGLIDPDAAHKMRDLTESPLPHHQARKAQFDEAREGVGQGGAEKIAPAAAQDDESGEADDPDHADAPANVSHRLKLATAREREARAAIAAMERDKMAGSLVERAEVDFVLADFGSTLRGLVEGLPDRMSPTLAAHRGDVGGIHKDLEDAAHDLLTEISDHMKRKMEAV